MWYGKGPGVDRSMDAIKHANLFGTTKYGGVLAIAGDDHACKSSTVPQQSEHMFVGASVPVLNPANVQDVLDYGLSGSQPGSGQHRDSPGSRDTGRRTECTMAKLTA